MDIIRVNSVLNKIMKEIILDENEEPVKFPKELLFCAGIGNPMFKIIVQKIDEDVFIDDNGCKWVRSDK